MGKIADLKISEETPTNPIDTPIELEVYKLQCKQKALMTGLRLVILILALVGSTVLGWVYDGQYLTYAFIFYGIVISFAIGQKVDLGSISEIIKR